jgi:hypothetical protein
MSLPFNQRYFRGLFEIHRFSYSLKNKRSYVSNINITAFNMYCILIFFFRKMLLTLCFLFLTWSCFTVHVRLVKRKFTQIHPQQSYPVLKSEPWLTSASPSVARTLTITLIHSRSLATPHDRATCPHTVSILRNLFSEVFKKKSK